MSIKLTDTQLVLLGAAAQRKDLCLVAAPTLKGATAQKVESKLISAGFVKEVKAKASDPTWRRDKESGASYALKLTAAGAKAIAVDDAAGPEYGGEKSDAPANDPIVDQETWDRVQLLLAEHAQRTAGNCQNSDALTGERIREQDRRLEEEGHLDGRCRSARLSDREPGASCCRGACRLRARSLSALSRHRHRRAAQGYSRPRGRPLATADRRDRQDHRRRVDQSGPSLQILSNPIYLGRLTHKGQVRVVFTIRSLIRRHGTGSGFCLWSMLSARPAIVRTQTRSSPASYSMTAATE